MARRRHHKKGHHCKVVQIKGQGRRRICRNSKGRITSNRKAH